MCEWENTFVFAFVVAVFFSWVSCCLISTKRHTTCFSISSMKAFFYFFVVGCSRALTPPSPLAGLNSGNIQTTLSSFFGRNFRFFSTSFFTTSYQFEVLSLKSLKCRKLEIFWRFKIKAKLLLQVFFVGAVYVLCSSSYWFSRRRERDFVMLFWHVFTLPRHWCRFHEQF